MQEPFKGWPVEDDGRILIGNQRSCPIYDASGFLKPDRAEYFLLDRDKGIVDCRIATPA